MICYHNTKTFQSTANSPLFNSPCSITKAFQNLGVIDLIVFFPSVTDEILNVLGTSTDPGGVFTDDLNDPSSARFKQLQQDFCAKVF